MMEPSRSDPRVQDRSSILERLVHRPHIAPEDDLGPMALVLPPGVQISDKKTEMRAMKLELERQKAQVEDRMKDLARQAEQVHEEENEFKALMLKHDATIRENLAKKQAARKQAAEQTKHKDEKNEQLKALQNEEKNLLMEKAELEKLLEEMQPFHEYMQQVWRASDGDFSDVGEIIHRYNTFKDTDTDLSNREAANSLEIAELKRSIVQLNEKKSTEILDLTTKLSSFEKQIEKYRSESDEWQSQLNTVQMSSATQNLLLSQIKMATSNLFHIVNGYIKTKKTSDTLEQLDRIGQFIFDLQELAADIDTLPQHEQLMERFRAEMSSYADQNQQQSDDATTQQNGAQDHMMAALSGGKKANFQGATQRRFRKSLLASKFATSLRDSAKKTDK